MAEETKIEAVTPVQSRRAFVKTAAQVAVTAPAAAMLLSASAKAETAPEPYRGNTPGPGDDAVSNDDGFFGDDGGTPGDDFIP